MEKRHVILPSAASYQYSSSKSSITSHSAGDGAETSQHILFASNRSEVQSPSVTSTHSGSNLSERLNPSEIKRILDKLKTELDGERSKNRRLLQERATEVRKMKRWFAEEKAAALEALAHDLTQEKERSLREKMNELSNFVRTKEEEIRQLRDQFQVERTEMHNRAQAEKSRERRQNAGTSEVLLRLHKEIKSLRNSYRELEEKYQQRKEAEEAARAEVERVRAQERARMANLCDSETQTDGEKEKESALVLVRSLEALKADLDAKTSDLKRVIEGGGPGVARVAEILDTLREMSKKVQLAGGMTDVSRSDRTNTRHHRSHSSDQEQRHRHNSGSDSGASSDAEEKVVKLKRRNAELAALARRMEEKVKTLQDSNQTKPNEATSNTDLDLIKREYDRRRGLEMGEHAKLLLEREKELEALRRQLEALKKSGQKGFERQVLDQMMKTANRERLVLEKQMAWVMDPESHDPAARERLQRLREEVAKAEKGREPLLAELDDLRQKTRKLNYLESSITLKDQDNIRLKEDLNAEHHKIKSLTEDVQRLAEKNTQLAVEASDLQTRVRRGDLVNEEKSTVTRKIHSLEVTLKKAESENSDLKEKVANMEELLRHLNEAAEKRKDLEREHANVKALLESKDREISRKDQDESMDNLKAKLRELEKRSALQALKHEEVLLELESVKKKQKYEELAARNLAASQAESAGLQNGYGNELQLGRQMSSSYLVSSSEPSATISSSSIRTTASSKLPPTPVSATLVGGRSVPTSLVTTAVTSQPSNGDSTSGGSGRRLENLQVFVAKYNYNPHQYSPNENPDLELRLNAGDYIIVHGTMDEDGFFYGELIDGRRGLVPSNFVEPVNIAELGSDFNLSAILGRPDGASTTSEDEKAHFDSEDAGHLSNQQRGGVDLIGILEADEAMSDVNSTVTSGSDISARSIPPPQKINLERQLTHSALIAWRSPEMGGQEITAYHIYVDGQFRTSVKSTDKTRALVDGVDANKVHRVSIRAVTSRGQSKDSECTLLVGRGASAAPSRLKATQITSSTAKLSWLPGNSNFQHAVVLNEKEICTCPPGHYKMLLSALQPDSLHRVSVIGRRTPAGPLLSKSGGLDVNAQLSASLEFRTLPGGVPESPMEVQVEAGPQHGHLLITWLPVSLEDRGTSNGLQVKGYAVCVNGRTVLEVPGAASDHAVLSIARIREVHGSRSSPSHSQTNSGGLLLTVRTLAQVPASGGGTVESDHSRPPVALSPGLDIAAPTSAHGHGSGRLLEVDVTLDPESELSDILEEEEDHLSMEARRRNMVYAERPSMEVGKSPTEEIDMDDSPPSKSIPVPEIHITQEGGSFSDEDLPLSRRHNRSPEHYSGRNHPGRGRTSPRRPLSEENLAQGGRPGPGGRPYGPRGPMGGRPDYTRSHSDSPGNVRDRGRRGTDGHGRSLVTDFDDEANSGDSLTEELGEWPAGPRELPPGGTVPAPRDQTQAKDGVRVFVALFDYDPATMSPNPDALQEELPFREGQLIKIFGEPDEDGFFYGECNGRRGLVPYNMISEVQVEHKQGQQPPPPGNERTAPRRDRPSEERTHRSSVEEDPRHHQTKPHPASAHPREPSPRQPYRRPASPRSRDDSPPPPPPPPPPRSGQHLRGRGTPNQVDPRRGRKRRMVALYDYDPHSLSPNVDVEVELAFRSGDIIYVLGEMDEDGFFMGETTSGRRGLVPSNFLQDEPEPGASPPVSPRGRPGHSRAQHQAPPPNRPGEQGPAMVRDNRARSSSGMSPRGPPPNHQPPPHQVPMSGARDSPVSTPRHGRDPRMDSDRPPRTPSTSSLASDQVRRGPPPPAQPGPPPPSQPGPSFGMRPPAPGMTGSAGSLNRVGRPQERGPSGPGLMPNPGQGSGRQMSAPPAQRGESPPHKDSDEMMPIVMDLGPPKESKKKISIGVRAHKKSDTDATSPSGHPPLLIGQQSTSSSSTASSLPTGPGGDVTPNSPERKRSVFKNPFKKSKK